MRPRNEAGVTVSSDLKVALGVRFADPKLARCVRETALLDPANVHTLKCYQCQIESLEGIQGLPNLLSLDLHFNEVHDGWPLARLRRLEELHLGLNQCSDLRFLEGMTALKSLTLFDNEIEDCRPVRGLKRLEVLHLRFNNIDDLSPLAGLTGVREFSISSNYVEDLSPLAGWARLEVFNFFNNYVEDVSILARMPYLKEVYLGHNPIRDLRPLFGLKNLIECRYEGTPAPDDHKRYVDQLIAHNKARLGLRA